CQLPSGSVIRPRGSFAVGWQEGAKLSGTSRPSQNHLPQGEWDGNRYTMTQYTSTQSNAPRRIRIRCALRAGDLWIDGACHRARRDDGDLYRAVPQLAQPIHEFTTARCGYPPTLLW